MSNTITEALSKAKERVISTAESHREALLEQAGLEEMRHRFPNATYENYLWLSPDVVPDSVDPSGINLNYYSTGYGSLGGRSVPWVLFQTISTPHGPFPVYSPNRVDVVEGFKAYNANPTGTTLIACLLATCSAANATFRKVEAEKAEEERRKAAEKGPMAGLVVTPNQEAPHQ